MIGVTRRVSPAEPGATDDLIRRLETEPGLFHGCDVADGGVYRREFWAFATPALGATLVGGKLHLMAFTETGRRLAALAERVAPIDWSQGYGLVKLPAATGDIHPAVTFLRVMLGLFDTRPPELCWYGAWSFDHVRLGGVGAALGDRRGFVVYLPERLLRGEADGSSHWVDLDFDLPADAMPLAEPTDRPAPLPTQREGDDLKPGGHTAMVERGVAQLRQGDLISLVLSQSFRRRFEGNAAEAFIALRRANPSPQMFLVNLGGGERLFGASPDLQARAADGILEIAPVCGTIRRGAGPVEDAAQAAELIASAVDAASLAVSSDAFRNDMARVCEPGSVELLQRRKLLFLGTVIHTVDHLRGKLRPGMDGFDMLLALAAPATVTGTPKAAALDVIEALEASPRGWYAGAVARIGADGSLEAGTILRAAALRDSWAEIRTGGNLLADSEPAKEEDESRLKAEALLRALGLMAQIDAATVPPPIRTPLPALELVDCGDPFPESVRDLLGKLGGGTDGRVTVLCGGRIDAAAVKGPVLALADAGFALLERAGAKVETVVPAETARPVAATATGCLAPLGQVLVGCYGNRRLRPDQLPAGWRASLIGADGRLLAAERDDGMALCLLFRPDSVVSLTARAGERIVKTAAGWLAKK